MRTRLAWPLGAVLVVSACSGGADTTTTASPPSTVLPVTSTTEAMTSTTGAMTTTIPVTTTTSRPIDVTVQAGRVAGPDRLDYSVGDEVSVWLLSDIADEIHVHGYDVFVAAQVGVPIEIALTADAPGIFEVELESSHTLLFELEVTP